MLQRTHRLGFGKLIPVNEWVPHGAPVNLISSVGRNLDIIAIVELVKAASFDDGNSDGRISGESSRQGQTCSSASCNHIVAAAWNAGDVEVGSQESGGLDLLLQVRSAGCWLLAIG